MAMPRARNCGLIGTISFGIGAYYVVHPQNYFLGILFFSTAGFNVFGTLGIGRPQWVTRKYLQATEDEWLIDTPADWKEALYGWFIMKELYQNDSYYAFMTDHILEYPSLKNAFDRHQFFPTRNRKS